MEEKLSEIVNEVTAAAATYGLDVLGAITILVLGLMFAGWAQQATLSALSRITRLDTTLRVFFASIVRYFIVIIVVLAVLNRFGVQTASLIAVLGAAGLAIGLAMQGTLSNVAAGVMLLIFRPFKVGDYIDAGGQAGTVQELGLFLTEMNTPDNIRISVPNAAIWGSAIKNYSINRTRRIDLVVGISYEDDIDRAIASLGAVIGADERIHSSPAPLIAVSELADSAVNLTVQAWCDTSGYGTAKFALTKAIKERLDADGITIPYPQRQVRMAQA
ncbi:MAG: mechanosensitive ion channel [Alphaproteobacteria bacterium]|nr:mechanosensitive ion channel [Alphaproteobacteria bacterium]